MRISHCLIAFALFAACTLPAGAGMITGRITADNHYALYTGSPDGSVVHFWGANEAGASGAPGTYNWSKAEYYNVNSPDPYIYIAAWSDDRVAQGLLLDLFLDGNHVLSGDPLWQVWATGIDLDDGAPPPIVGTMMTQIGLANASGWQTPYVGVANGAGPWGTIANIDHTAKWMWFSPTGGDALTPGANHDEFLIFRRAIPEPTTLSLMAAGVVGLLLRRR